MPSPAILVVDDSSLILHIISRVLQHLELELVMTGSGLTALYHLSRRHFDLVITDIHMAGVSGWDILNRVKREAPGTTVIIMSGDANPAVAIEAERLGADGFVAKPFSAYELRAMVHKVLQVPGEKF